MHDAMRRLAPRLRSVRIEGSCGDHHPLPADARSALTQLTRLELTHPTTALKAWLPPALEELVVPRWGVAAVRGGGGG